MLYVSINDEDADDARYLCRVLDMLLSGFATIMAQLRVV
jgi:hypothetical protein